MNGDTTPTTELDKRIDELTKIVAHHLAVEKFNSGAYHNLYEAQQEANKEAHRQLRRLLVQAQRDEREAVFNTDAGKMALALDRTLRQENDDRLSHLDAMLKELGDE